MRRAPFAILAALGLALAARADAQAPMPIFDTHVHYSQPAWEAHPPEAVVRALNAAGVPRALVSSTPDDGSLTLAQRDARRFVPMLRPYRGAVTSGNWTSDPELGAYLEARLKAGRYAGIGEFHLFDPNGVKTPQVKRVIELAVERDIYLHIHSDARPVRALYTAEPRLKILWAHAGMSEPPDVVADMLERHPSLVTELSFRTGDIAPGGQLAPAWRALFMKHTRRVMVGTDTYVTSRWDGYGAIVEDHRRYLAQLPREVAEAIAWRNAARLFGTGDAPEFKN
ncbi:MAG: amidohydrolase [Alphaproteobacteria bacterium]|nr:amidohydrolase [Alphaproteobacteria bacterium]